MVQQDGKVQRYGAQERRRTGRGEGKREVEVLLAENHSNHRNQELTRGQGYGRRAPETVRTAAHGERKASGQVDILPGMVTGKSRAAGRRDASEVKIAIDYVEFPGGQLAAGYGEQGGYQRTAGYGNPAQYQKETGLPSVGRSAKARYVPNGRQSINGSGENIWEKPLTRGGAGRECVSAGRRGGSRGCVPAGRQGGARPVLHLGARRMSEPIKCQGRSGYGKTAVRGNVGTGSGRNVSRRSAARALKRRHEFIQRLAVSVWALSLVCLVVTLLVLHGHASAAGDRRGDRSAMTNGSGTIEPKRLDDKPSDAILVQGLPATDFARHPEWTEDFLTPNEYSRPGDALESVKNIFVHYTANPGTSAAQNRSYFERQKDEHQASVSAHFIIGYEGEIIQCVPLDEVAYAVKSRNYDSISIECCHLEKDGSFTEATYDSLISLLKWLIDVYGLESDDILRHYDCGGKKCPLYYTDHPDAWEELKKDVDKL